MSEDIDIDHYSEVLKKQSRNESDKLRNLKRKITDNNTIQEELTEEEIEMLKTSIKHEIDTLEEMADNSKKFLEEKIDAADQD